MSEPTRLRMNAYYYSFDETGQRVIDRVLSAVACAGKSYHDTSEWNDSEDWNGQKNAPHPEFGGVNCQEWIQNAANDAAQHVAALTAQLEAAQRERDKFVRLYERVEIDLFFMEERAQDAEAKLTAAQSERDSYKRQAHGASEALLETMRLREVETERACAAQSEAAALREALAGLVEQKHEPSEYYGVNDDMRCAFCGEDYIGHDRDEGARHTPACAWQAALALLAGQPAPEGRREP